MSNGEYANRKNPDMTYVSRAVDKNKNVHYISKVFNLRDFKDFYFDQKSKKVFEVIRESSTQEITAIYNKETTGFSVRIQRFAKSTGIPHNQSFSFYGDDLSRFIRFLLSLDLIGLNDSENLKFTGQKIDDLIERKKQFRELLRSGYSPNLQDLIELFNKLENTKKVSLFETFIKDFNSLEVENLNAAIKQKEYKESVKDLEALLEMESNTNFLMLVRGDVRLFKYQSGQPEGVFQSWINSNLWIFGSDYYKKHTFRKIAEDNSKADIVLETLDGFISLIEIKLPKKTKSLFIYDESHRSYFPASWLSEAIGQSLIYLQRIEDYKRNLESEHGISVLRPKIKLIIGRSLNLSDEERRTLYFLNSSIHNIDIITYDQLIANANQIISYYEKK